MKANRQNHLYAQVTGKFGLALSRLVRAYEADEEKRRDLTQEIHFQLWRSLAAFNGRCSLRTWGFRVAHNTAATHVMKEKRRSAQLVSLEELEFSSGEASHEDRLHQNRQLEKLAALIHRLKPIDRQVMVSYLEELEAQSIAEITGLSAANVAMKIHRINKVLAQAFQEAQ